MNVEEQVRDFAGPRFSSAVMGNSLHAGFGGFAALPSNVGAMDATLAFATGDSRFVALVGPSGWGKTYLLEAASQLSRRVLGVSAQVEDASAWLQRTQRADLGGPLILDQAQACLGGPRSFQALRSLIEHRQRLQRPTLLAFTLDRPTWAMRQVLRGREWQIAELAKPARQERQAIIRQIANNERLVLSDRLVNLLAKRIHGNGNSFLGAVQRLKLLSLGWTTPEAELRALGVLRPHLTEKGGWDLRDTVHETVERVMQNHPDLGSGFGRDLCLYCMVRYCGIPENEAGAFFDLHSGAVFSAVQSAESRSQGPLAPVYAECLHALVRSVDAL